MKLYIIRHGQTEWNRVLRLQGQTDIPLNENGLETAEKVGQALADVPFTAVISSPLKRAYETACMVVKGRELEVKTDERLREISFGVYEGYSTFNPEYPMPDPEFHYFFDAPEKYHPPRGGESFPELMERAGSFLRDLAASDLPSDSVILASAHGAVSRALLAQIKNTPINLFWDGGVPPNCSVSIAETTPEGKWRLLQQDVTW